MPEGTEGTQQQNSAAGQPAAGAQPWHGITDPTEASYVQNKGWTSPADVIKSYQGAEKLIGRDPTTLLTIPRADDAAGFRAVMTKLGLPDSPAKYEFDVPQGVAPDEAYMGWARDTFHKIGLPAPIAKQLTAEHNKYLQATMEKQAQDYELRVSADKQTLLREWGGGHERMMNAAQTAAKALNFTPEMVDAMEHAIGYAGTMKFFAQLGQKLGEDKFVSQDGSRANFSDTLTPEEAKQQWDQAKLDPQFTAALKDKQHPGHAAAAQKQTKLFAIMFPER